jgi:dihydrofolate reductase
MRKLNVFNSISLDGYFTDAKGDISWAHNVKEDAEFNAFVSGNAGGGGTLVFGRITYEMMVSFWPTPAAKQSMPVVAERMNNGPKIVFSRTMEKASWNNTTLIKSDMAAAMRRLKSEPGETLTILGSGTIVSQLAGEGLIDEYSLVVVPVVLGDGRTMFDGVKGTLGLTLTKSRSFSNGNVLLSYAAIR